MYRIKKLDIYITKQFLLLFAGTFFISLFVLMMQFLWRYVDEVIGKGLSMEVLAQFFWYMGLMLIPQALPLAILLASLITMGNIGENSELTAIKAAGISLLQILRPLIFIVCLTTVASFYFQNNIGPHSTKKLAQLLNSMKQKSPELEIPEGIFYDGIPNCNLYVQKKDLEKGMLYGIMIYRMTNSFEDAAIILADSGRLQSTADKEHLLLSLYNGEWFENMRSQEFAGTASVPYRRESFISKRIVLDFDSGLNLADESNFAGKAQAKSLKQIFTAVDSMNHVYDSIGRGTRKDLERMYNSPFSRELSKSDSLAAVKMGQLSTYSFDTIVSRLKPSAKREALQHALFTVQDMTLRLSYIEPIVSDGDQTIRKHWLEAVNKFTLSLTCLIFFFIGAPLGAIIRKGGLGVPIIISVIVFIVFYILDNTGFRMARIGAWPIWFGKGLAPAVLIPLASFVTYKANKDSMVFNMDAYRNAFMRILGLRLKRHVASKEVIINDPDYRRDADRLSVMSHQVRAYAYGHHLMRIPNFINVFFRYQPDHEIERISAELEEIIEDLSNTRDRFIMSYLNQYPIVSLKAHTRPFERKWMNITAAIILPVGIFLYLRMWRFRLRLLTDLRKIRATNTKIVERISKLDTM
ncbi:MAG: LptF/LptG family permease [Prevotella sp.]|nr:LptF/LptG family permease [Prevotella sp.]